ncbi:MAG TPA: MFS transporter [Bryobacteraceae bacterium]|nr:MFS transporter [Bryobacteraceae bacterium]
MAPGAADATSSQGKPGQQTSSVPPSKVRHGVVGFAVALSMITYIDRVALSNARKQVATSLHLSDAEMGLVFTAFAVAYALFEIPSGFMGDRLGPRRVLLRITIWWSIFTAVTGRAWNFISLWISQFLFGAGEAGCYPNIARAFTVWLPQSERVRAQGIIWMSSRWGGAFTPLLVALLFQYMDWRLAFTVFGFLGIIWTLAFAAWYKDNPRDKKGVNAGELELLSRNPKPAPHGFPWRDLLASKTVVLLCLQYFAVSFTWYFLITWAPTFVDERFHLDVTQSTILKTLPLLAGGFGSITCGMMAKPLARWTGSVINARRIAACTGFAGASACLVLATLLHQPFLVVGAIAMSSFCNDLVMPAAWGAVMDISGSYSGTVAGSMNMVGNLGGALYGTVSGLVLQYSHRNWDYVLYMGAAVYMIGFFIWTQLDPVTPIEWRAHAAASPDAQRITEL